MKLTDRGVDRTLDQYDAEPLPENHPAVPQLNRVFERQIFRAKMMESGCKILGLLPPETIPYQAISNLQRFV